MAVEDEQAVACGRLTTAFDNAVNRGVAFANVYRSRGYPSELTAGAPDEIERNALHMKAYGRVQLAAEAARDEFELAMVDVERVGSRQVRDGAELLRVFLHDTLYSGAPWDMSNQPPTANLNPPEIVFSAHDRTLEFARIAGLPRFGPAPTTSVVDSTATDDASEPSE